MPSSALTAAIAAFASDPASTKWNTTDDIGGCWAASHAFALTLRDFGVSARFRRFVNLPGLRTDRQHTIEVDGLIVDSTAQQHEASAPFPLVEPVAAYMARGFVPADIEICAVCGNGTPSHECHGLQADPGWYARRALAALLQELGLS